MKPTSSSNLSASEQLFPGFFRIADKTIIPVLSSTYHTIDLIGKHDTILYSDGVTACAVLVIKNSNEETGKYDNVVTMAHFFPNNGFDIRTAQGNIYAAMEDFVSKGGKLSSSKTSFQIFGGYDLPGRPFRESVKAILIDAITEMGIPSKHKFINHESSILRNYSDSLSVFVDSQGTQITKRNRDDRSISALATVKESMPLELLESVIYNPPSNYTKFADKVMNDVAIASQEIDGMGLSKMSDVVKQNITSREEKLNQSRR